MSVDNVLFDVLVDPLPDPGGGAGSGIDNIVEDTTPQLGGHLDSQGYDIKNVGVMFQIEQAAAEADVAGSGQWWVKTASPNLPMFTDDAGNDWQIATLTGASAFANKTINADNNTITNLGAGSAKADFVSGLTEQPSPGSGDMVMIYDAGLGALRKVDWDQVAAAAGSAFLSDLVDDTTPQLGGTLDANGQNIDMGVNTITDTKVGEWTTAHGWGDHSTEGYLKNLSEDTTPTLGGNLDATGRTITTGTYTITDTKVGQWDTAYGWGNHASAGYLTAIADGSVTEAKLDALNSPTDGYVLAYDATSGQLEWLSVGGTGTVTSVGVSVPTGLSVSGSPVTSAGTIAITLQAGYSIPTTTKQGEWDTAYGWGNHASAGYITSSGVTYENLSANGDVGTGASQVAAGNHTHSGVYEPADATILKDADIGSTVQAYDADTLKADTADVLTAGFATTAYNAGTKSSGTYTPDEANGNHQYAVNGGAHTLAPPTNNCSLVVHYTNNASAGAITVSGFTLVDGDSFSTTNAEEFLAYITKANDVSHLTIKALQ